MKDQAKLPVIVLVVVVAVGLLFFFGSKAMSTGNLDQGQVKYTPGVPPWQEKNNAGNQPSEVGSNGLPAGMTQPSIGGNETK